MKRLTQHMPVEFGYCEYQIAVGVNEEDFINRLGSYEDTGLTPEQITAMQDELARYKAAGLTPDEVNATKHALMGKVLAEITEFEGIPIDRLKEMAVAEQDGRLVVLPCKVGNMVWAIVQCADIVMHHDNDYFTGTGAVECPFEGNCNHESCNDEQSQILESIVTNWWLQDGENQEEPEAFLEHIQKSYYLRDFGKTVFLSREEAVAALEKMRGECE